MLYYKQKTRDRIEFPVPIHFQWVGGGSDFTTGFRDWEIEGEKRLGNAVEELAQYCENLVSRGEIYADFRIEIRVV